jgi:hypothetical protein
MADSYNWPMVGAALLIALGLAQAGQTPVPRPFPQPGTPGTTTQQAKPPQQPPQATPKPPAIPVPAPSQSAPPTATAPTCGSSAPAEATLGVAVYPGSQFLTSYDAGRGQRFYLFGSATSFLDLVKYYRTLLKQNGDLVFDTPATHEFDVGKFREETMAFPPGVTIKDYKSEMSDGYPNPKPGCEPARFQTVIQIVPVPATDR